MQNNSPIYLSVLIPAYNEESRLPQTLDSTFKFLDTKEYTYEVIVIDDGSVDKTAELAKSNPNFPDKLKLIRHSYNSGKGYAIKIGVQNARGEYIIYVDADGATPIEEIDKLFNAVNNGYDIAIASRALKRSKVVDFWYRR